VISCTDFILSYSELFRYLESHYGRQEVDRYWEAIFTPDGNNNPLILFVQKEGIRGCMTYWSGTLNEEAADFTMYLNEKAGWFLLEMHHCPSKGRLLKLKEEIGIVPYHHYCLHCDSYRSAIEKVGLGYIYNFAGMDHAACSILIYDPKTFKGQVIVNEDTEIMDRKAAENEYFHPDFHSSMNMGIHYVGENYGMDAVREYLTMYTNDVYGKVVEDGKARGLAAIAAKIVDTYTKEKALDALTIEDKGNELYVSIAYCPAVKHLKATGRKVSEWYRYTTEIVMDVLAQAIGAEFSMDSYDDATGAANYHFTVK
jgi:hypothetical protein